MRALAEFLGNVALAMVVTYAFAFVILKLAGIPGVP